MYFFFQITIHTPLLTALLNMQTQHTAYRFETIIYFNEWQFVADFVPLP